MGLTQNTGPVPNLKRSKRSIGGGEAQQFGRYGAGITRLLHGSPNTSSTGLTSSTSSSNVLRKKGPKPSQLHSGTLSTSPVQQIFRNTPSYAPLIPSPLNPFADPPSVESSKSTSTDEEAQQG